MLHMDRIGVRELRQNASKYLRRVEQGETIEVTDRGRPVARLTPIPRGDLLDQMIADGRVRAPKGNLLALGPPLPLKPGTRLPSELVSEMRDE